MSPAFLIFMEWLHREIERLEGILRRMLYRVFLQARGASAERLFDAFEGAADDGGRWHARDMGFNDRTRALERQLDWIVQNYLAQVQEALLNCQEAAYRLAFYVTAYQMGIEKPYAVASAAIRSKLLATFIDATQSERFTDLAVRHTTQLRRAVVQSQTNGDNWTLASRRIAGTWGEVERSRDTGLWAMVWMLGVTELWRAMNLAIEEQIVDHASFIEGKEWVGIWDMKICKRCAKLHQQQVPFYDYFTDVYTGIKVTAPPLHGRCRCMAAPILLAAQPTMGYDAWADLNRVSRVDDGRVMWQ